MPRHGVPEPGRPSQRSRPTRTSTSCSRRAQHRLSGPEHDEAALRRRARAARHQHGDRQGGRSSRPSTRAPAWSPRTRSRRRSWSYNDDIEDYPYDPAAAQQLLVEAGLAEGFETDLWYMPVSRPYNPNGKRVAEMIQADLAKIGIRAKLVTDEWSRLPREAAGRRDLDGALRLDRRQRRPRQFPRTSCSAAPPRASAATTSPNGATATTTSSSRGPS